MHMVPEYLYCFFDILDVKIYYFLGGRFYLSKKGGIYVSASVKDTHILINIKSIPYKTQNIKKMDKQGLSCLKFKL